ncbi:MAG: site-2 protease family protein [Rhabdochlamydiaceae bacterium]|nr:site-2 protease family protein [Candidatus Amphrikana amoebophyrae]
MNERKKIPLRISPFFFLTAGVIGYLNSGSLMGMLLWIAVIFVSILIHEFGHALFGRMFGQSPSIELTALGGVTYASNPKLSLPKEFLVVLAGPAFGFCLCLISWLVLSTGFFTNRIVIYLLDVSYLINLIWTALNLFPVLPLDGGQLMRIIFEGVFGHKGRRGAFLASLGIALVGALVFIYIGYYIISVLFFMFAFQNFEFARQIRASTEHDDDEDLKKDLAKAESLIMNQRSNEAMQLLRQIREKSKKGMVFQLATQDLARSLIYLKEYQEAYELLHPHINLLSDTGKSLLQHAAYEVGDYKTALSLSGNCLVNLPDGDLLLRAAAAAAELNEIQAAMGWLQTAKDFGCKNLNEFLGKEHFNTIRDSEDFKAFQKLMEQN